MDILRQVTLDEFLRAMATVEELQAVGDIFKVRKPPCQPISWANASIF